MIDTFEQQLSEVSELISLPEVYLKISHLMNDPMSDVTDFAEIIRFDPNLSASVLKLVNSAFYGLSGEVDSINQAVTMLGLGQLHIMALSISAVSALNAMNYPEDILSLKTFWQSNLFCGVLSRHLALHLKVRNSENLFVIGLLHEIGHLVLYTKFPEKARESIELAKDQNLLIHEAELQVIGCHYGKIGANLQASWKLPLLFQGLTEFQPTPLLSNENQLETAILHVAHAYAFKEFINDEKPIEELVTPAVWEKLQLISEDVDSMLERAHVVSNSMAKTILK